MRSFSFLNRFDYGTPPQKKKYDIKYTFLVKLHLDDVLEVLLLVGVEFLSNETCI